MIDIATMRDFKSERRSYVGASGVGNPCQAYQALCLRGFPSDTPEPKLIRIFAEGHRIETMVVEHLRAAGFKVEAVDPATGRQWKFFSQDGHHICNLDGFITMPGEDRMVLEIKSMNHDSFVAFKNQGIAKSHPMYYDQMQDQMALVEGSAIPVRKALMVAYCKDNSEFWLEIVSADRPRQGELSQRAVNAIYHAQAKRATTFEASFTCKECFKRTACWHPEKAVVSHCSQCKFATPTERKEWLCTLRQPNEIVSEPCSSFETFEVEP